VNPDGFYDSFTVIGIVVELGRRGNKDRVSFRDSVLDLVRVKLRVRVRVRVTFLGVTLASKLSLSKRCKLLGGTHARWRSGPSP